MPTLCTRRRALLLCMVVGVLLCASAGTAQTIAPPSPRTVAAAADAARTPIQRKTADGQPTSARPPASPWGTLIVLGGIVAAVVVGAQWLKRAAPQRFGGLSVAAIDLLGSCPVTPHTAMHVVRVGDRVLVVGSGTDGLRTLMEVTDPAEAAHLMHLCRAQAETRTDWNPLHRLGGRRSRRPSEPRTDEHPQSDSAGADAEPGGLHHAAESPRRSPAVRAAAWLVLLAWGSTPLFAQPPVGPASNQTVQFGAVVLQPSPNPDTAPPQSHLLPTWSGDPPSQLLPAATGTPPIQRVNYTSDAPAARSPSPIEQILSPQGLGPSLRLGLVVGALSLAPAILLMTTCYVRIVIVLGLLRQAIGAPQFPPTQVLTALSLFLTALVMWPTWERCYREGVVPYAEAAGSDGGGEADLRLALTRTAGPLRSFMSKQIETTGHGDAIDLLMSYHTGSEAQPPATYYDEVPTQVLLPAYILSELQTAFLIGFQVYLPFVVIDLVVTSVLASLGLGTLAPAVVSLPLKLLLFVMIDGWFLVVETLLQGLYGG